MVIIYFSTGLFLASLWCIINKIDVSNNTKGNLGEVVILITVWPIVLVLWIPFAISTIVNTVVSRLKKRCK